jgi:hypothetical protein
VAILSWFLGPIGRYVTAAVALLAALWLAYGSVHHDGWKSGVAAQVAVDSKAMGISQAKADKETARLHRLADTSEAQRVQAQIDLTAYRTAHPVHLFVQHAQACGAGSVPEVAGAGAAGTAPTGVLQPQPASTDIGPALDVKAAEADGWVEQYRVCRAAYQSLVPAVIQ